MHRCAIRKDAAVLEEYKGRYGEDAIGFSARTRASVEAAAPSLVASRLARFPRSSGHSRGSQPTAREGSEAADGGTDPKIPSRLVGKAFPPGGRTKNLRRDRSSSVRRGTN